VNVLLVGDVPPPPGGIAIHVHQLAGELAARGAAVQVVDTGKGRHRGLGVRPLGGAGGLAREVVSALGRDALVHVHVSGNNPKAWALAAAFGAPHARGARRLLTVHSGLAPAFLSRQRSHRWIARAALSGYASVVAVSEAVRDALAEVGNVRSRVHVVPAFLGVPEAPAPLPGAVKAWRARFRPLVAWASHPSPTYGLAHALDALAALPSAGAVVFGPGTEETAFRSDVARRGLGARVLGLGAISHAGALSVMRAADLFWRPTLADGDSLSVREACALGVRCLASDAAPRPPGVPVYRTGDAAALAGASLQVLSRPPPAAGVGAGAEALWSLYLALAGGAGPSGERRKVGCAG